MKKEVFNYLCNTLRPTLFRQDTQLRRAITVERRVALTTTSEYQTIVHLFGVAKSTVCSILHKTCSAIVSLLLKTYHISYG